MDLDAIYASLTAAMRRVEDARGRTDQELAALQAQLALIVDVLVGSGQLGEGHRKLLQRVAKKAAEATRPRVRLRLFIDKYAVQCPDIDCPSLIPLCRARCCSLSFELTSQDLDEGKVRWELEEPYLIRHERDGFCSHLARPEGGCTIYEHRPATCRSFDCREDRRIWLDFEKRIPAP